MLTINDEQCIDRAEIIWEKGTNRSAFFKGEVDKYGWVDIGSSFLPTEVVSAFLYAQLEHLDDIQNKRKLLWDNYYKAFETIENPCFTLAHIPEYGTNNAHMFYLVCKNIKVRDKIIQTLKENGIWAVFHYLSLHSSPYYSDKHDGRKLINCDSYSECLVRLPLFYSLSKDKQSLIIQLITNYCN
jgi:dTDP-4-amino-4,6-dideoxygalactose transaminase